MNADEVQKAVQWLIDNAEPAAEARGQRIQLEEFTKHLKAKLMQEVEDVNEGTSVSLGAQERLALSDARYATHLEGLKEAVKRDERFRWLRDTAHAKIELFRTLESSKRKLGL